MVAFQPQTGDDAHAGGAGEGFVPEFFALIDVGDVNFDGAELRTEDRIAQGDTGVSESGTVDHEPVNFVVGKLRDTINEFAFMIALEEGELGLIGEGGGELGFEFGEGGGAVDLRFAFAQSVEIGTVEDGDAFHGKEKERGEAKRREAGRENENLNENEKDFAELQGVVRANKFPGEVEFGGEFGGEGLDGVDLSGVVTAEEDVDAALLGDVEPLLPQFAGDHGVDIGFDEFFHGAVAAAGAEGDPAGRIRSAVDGHDAFVMGFKLSLKFGASAGVGRRVADGFTGDDHEGLIRREAELAGEQGVVTDLGVAVEREVIGVKGTVALNEGSHALVDGTGQQLRHIPIHAVVYDEKVDAAGSGQFEGNEAGVDGGTNAGDFTIVGDLEAVFGPRGIGVSGEARALVAVSHQFVERSHENTLGGNRRGFRGGFFRNAL